jgi:hypothetical protein
LAATLIACTVAGGQSSAPAQQSRANASPASTTPPELQDVKTAAVSSTTPLKLKGVGPSNPQEAAKLAARDLAVQKNGQDGGKPAGSVEAQAGKQAQDQTRASSTPEDAVVEFHPATSSVDSASPAVVKDGKSRATRVHGDLYGATGAAGHATGESVGATSKSGKTSVYVQSDQARSTTSQPQ